MEGVKTTLALQKTASQERISNYVKERENLMANNAAVDADFWQDTTDMDAKLGRLEASLDDETRRGNEEGKERKRFVSFQEVS